MTYFSNDIPLCKMTYSLILFVFFLACNTQKSKNEQIDIDYPHIIDSLKVHEQYDDLKWKLYSFYAMDSCMLKEEIVRYGEHNLQLTYVNKQDSILEISFYNPNLSCFKKEEDYFFISGATFINDSIASYETETVFQITEITSESRLYKSESSEKFEDYLADNSDKITPWLKKEAIKRGIIRADLKKE